MEVAEGPTGPQPGADGGFSTVEIAETLAAGALLEVRACERMIDRWRTAGTITPSIQDASGSGSRVRWSRGDLWRLRRIWELRETMRRYDMKLSHALVAEVWDALYEGRTPPLHQGDLVSLNP